MLVQVHVVYWAGYFDRSTQNWVGRGGGGGYRGELTTCWGGVAHVGVASIQGVVPITCLVLSWYSTTGT